MVIQISTRDIVEFAGISGVIASLIFVGFEIQQNSAIARASARQAISDNGIEIAAQVSTNPVLAEILSRVFSPDFDIDTLTPAEAMMTTNYFMGFMQMWESEFEAISLGILPEKDLDDLGIEPINNNFMRARWPELRFAVSDEFAAFVESKGWLN